MLQIFVYNVLSFTSSLLCILEGKDRGGGERTKRTKNAGERRRERGSEDKEKVERQGRREEEQGRGEWEGRITRGIGIGGE